LCVDHKRDGNASGNHETKIQLEFRVAHTHLGGQKQQLKDAPADVDFNHGLDGTAFVPAALPWTRDSVLRLQYVARTEEFDAALLRQNSDPSESEDFPSLQETVNQKHAQ
jgi:hypothetical protein